MVTPWSHHGVPWLPSMTNHVQNMVDHGLTMVLMPGNAGNTDGLQKAIRLIAPHVFGNQEHCLQSWCGYKQDPASYKHRDLPFGKDLLGESLKRSLEEVFEIYSS